LDLRLREHGLPEGPFGQGSPDAEVDEVFVAGARGAGEPSAQVELLRAGVEEGGIDVGEMGPHLPASTRIEGMRQEKVRDPLARPVEGVLAGRRLERISLPEEGAMPRAGERQGRREAWHA